MKMQLEKPIGIAYNQSIVCEFVFSRLSDVCSCAVGHCLVFSTPYIHHCRLRPNAREYIICARRTWLRYQWPPRHTVHFIKLVSRDRLQSLIIKRIFNIFIELVTRHLISMKSIYFNLKKSRTIEEFPSAIIPEARTHQPNIFRPPILAISMFANGFGHRCNSHTSMSQLCDWTSTTT